MSDSFHITQSCDLFSFWFINAGCVLNVLKLHYAATVRTDVSNTAYKMYALLWDQAQVLEFFSFSI